MHFRCLPNGEILRRTVQCCNPSREKWSVVQDYDRSNGLTRGLSVPVIIPIHDLGGRLDLFWGPSFFDQGIGEKVLTL